MSHYPTAFWIAIGASCAFLVGAFFLVGGHHEIAWRLRQRRRVGVLEFDRRRP